MSQREKAREFIRSQGRAADLNHISVRTAPKHAGIGRNSNEAVDGSMMGADGLAGGGSVRRPRLVPVPRMIPKPSTTTSPMGAPGADPALASPGPGLKRGGRT